MGIAARGKVHSNTVCSPYRDHSIRNLEHQPGAPLQSPAVFISSVIGSILQELVQQIPIRTVHFNTVETRRLRVLGTSPKVLDDPLNLT